MTNRTRADVLLIAGFCAFLFFYGLGQFGLIGADEPRYAQVAREMLDRHDWITPTLGGRPWLEKPPLYYWQAMIVYSLFGVRDVTARVPSGIDATILVVAVYVFFRRFKPGLEVDAALIAASCAAVIGYARAASTDMPLVATFSVGMLAWWAWRESEKKIFLALFYVCLALGMLAKGPVAPFLAAVIIALYAAATRNWRWLLRTLWFPGVLSFCVIALPWYFAVQLRNPEFFREFILQHNLARFSTNVFHHPEPFWYYVPVIALALVPWIVFVIAAFVERVRLWWSERKSTNNELDLELNFGVFACCWLIVPVILFSLSQSKLPGYILPAVPAGALVLADYLRQHLGHEDPTPRWLVVLHALVAAGPMIPAMLLTYLVAEHRLPGGRPLVIALSLGFLLCAAIGLTLVSRSGLRMLRFVTLIPVVLAVAAVLKLGTTALDQKFSTRPLATDLASVEMHQQLPVAVFGVPREVEYGLAFYRNQSVARYESGNVPPGEHLLVVLATWDHNVAGVTAGRRVTFLGHYVPQGVDYFWVAATAPR